MTFARVGLPVRVALRFACALLAIAAPLRAEDAADSGKDGKEASPQAKVALPPDIEEKLAKFLKSASEVKRKAWAARMKKEIADVSQTVALKSEQTAGLEEPSGQAIEACLGPWTGKLDDYVRKNLQQHLNQAGMMINQMVASVEGTAETDWFGNFTMPYESATWTGALQQVLTPEQFILWNKTQADRKAAAEKEIAPVVDATVGRVKLIFYQKMAARSAEIDEILSLPKDRQDQLDALAKSASEKTDAPARKVVEKALLSVPESQRKEIVKTGRYYVQPEEKDLTDATKAWDDGLASLLSPAELKQWEDGQEQRKQRRIEAMGDMMIMFMDEKVALTASQRDQLQPLARRLVKGEEGLFQDAAVGYYMMSPLSFLEAASRAGDSDLDPILDAGQRQRWRDGVVSGRIAYENEDNDGPPLVKPVSNPEPDEVENAFSDFLYERAQKERAMILDTNTLKAEDATRVAGLPTDVTARLLTAAKGDTEDYMAGWSSSMNEMVRSQVQGVTPANARQRLASIEEYVLHQNQFQASRRIWDGAVKVELNPQQQQAWKKELDARSDYKDRAITGYMLSEFDRKYLLSADQYQKLAPVFDAAIKDYGPDLGRMFGFGYGSSPWYMQPYYMFVVVCAEPEEKLKTVLAKTQWEHWSGSAEFANAINYLQNIKNLHDQRVKSNAGKAQPQ